MNGLFFVFILFCVAVMIIDEAVAKHDDLNNMANNNKKEE